MKNIFSFIQQHLKVPGGGHKPQTALLKYSLPVFLILIMASSPHPALAQQNSGAGLTLELPGFWGHLKYVINGGIFETPTGSDRGKVGGRQYKGQLEGNELSVSGTAVSDNESRGPGSLDYYELSVSVTVGKETKKYNYIAPLGEKLSKPFFLSVPIDPAATNGSFSISLLENTAYYGQFGWVVSGFLTRNPISAPTKQTPEPVENVEPENRKKSGARFTQIHGEVRVLHAGGDPKKESDWKFAQREQALYVGDRIKTGEDSDCSIGFSDMSTFVLKPESEIELADPPNKDSKFRLVMGNIWTNVKKMVQNGSMEIDMDQAVAGIKGTTFIASTTKTASTLKVIEGSVSFRSKAKGTTVMVNSGEMITATKTGLSPKMKFDVNADSKEWADIKNYGISGKEIIVFKMESAAGVHGNPSNPTVFELTKPTKITRLVTYHWNDGTGSRPEFIGVKNANTGEIIGKWNALGDKQNMNVPGGPLPNKNVAPYLYCTAIPSNLVLQPGRYEVIDADPATWSTNTEMGNRGCAWVYGKQ